MTSKLKFVLVNIYVFLKRHVDVPLCLLSQISIHYWNKNKLMFMSFLRNGRDKMTYFLLYYHLYSLKSFNSPSCFHWFKKLVYLVSRKINIACSGCLLTLKSWAFFQYLGLYPVFCPVRYTTSFTHINTIIKGKGTFLQ